MKLDAETPALTRAEAVLLILALALSLHLVQLLDRPVHELRRARAALVSLDRSSLGERFAAAVLLVGILASMVLA